MSPRTEIGMRPGVGRSNLRHREQGTGYDAREGRPTASRVSDRPARQMSAPDA